MSKQTKIMIVVAMIAAITGLLVSNNYYNNNDDVVVDDNDNNNINNKLEYQSLLIYPEAKSFSGFQLQSHDNPNLTIEDFAGKWTLLFFGFTHCPDVCPNTLTELQKVFKLLKTKVKPEVLFISIDPDRDKPEALNIYTQFFNTDFKSATADAANILSITSQVGVAYHIQEHEEGDLNYNVDHTTAVFLVNPDKQLYGLFRSPHEAEKIADDLTLLLENK
ncbi:MAG: SCO family protein [Proteobacteria bacterium]|nr:SCO family protein [Pseudomonadota bacterium]